MHPIHARLNWFCDDADIGPARRQYSSQWCASESMRSVPFIPDSNLRQVCVGPDNARPPAFSLGHPGPSR
jgi:hypothetical protein